MNEVDKSYLSLIRDILDHGVEKSTRAGDVYSVFGRQLRFDLKEGLPLLTTKKVFTKGIIHELLWFLQKPYNSHGSMNIEYLIRNGVHIWDDDAYRWFKNEVAAKYKNKIEKILVCTNDDNFGKKPAYEDWINGETVKNDDAWLENITKEEFLDLTLQRVEIRGPFELTYRFGDLGQIYGKQWRAFGYSMIDQINEIINTLKTNPNDRRMLCVAFNPDVLALGNAALPPCHVMFQFYTRELRRDERLKYLRENYDLTDEEYNGMSGEYLDKYNVPRYGLSCMYTMRSNDYFLGQPFNTASYSILTYMIAKLVNMVPDEVIASLGDCHIYKAHIEAVKEQLQREGSDVVPKLVIHGNQKTIDDFRYEDFEIIDYNPDPPIKAPLLVG
jgi:thymidylate synthase